MWTISLELQVDFSAQDVCRKELGHRFAHRGASERARDTHKYVCREGKENGREAKGETG